MKHKTFEIEVSRRLTLVQDMQYAPEFPYMLWVQTATASTGIEVCETSVLDVYNHPVML